MKTARAMQKISPLRPLALLSIVGFACFLALVVLLHILRPDYDPLSRTVSEYAIGPYGFLMTIGFVALGLGSVSLFLALGTSRPGASHAGLVLLALWSLGVLLLSIFHTDRYGIPTSLGGIIHSFAALIALLSLVLSSLLYSLYFRRHERWQSFARTSLLVTFLMFITLIAFLASPVAFKGISERVLLFVDMLWLVGLANQLMKVSQIHLD